MAIINVAFFFFPFSFLYHRNISLAIRNEFQSYDYRHRKLRKKKKSNKRSISIAHNSNVRLSFSRWIEAMITYYTMREYDWNFREIRQKADVVFHPENHTVSYFNRRWWFFVPELTNGSLNDRVTQLNTVAIVSKMLIFLSLLYPFADDTFRVSVGETQGTILGGHAAKHPFVDARGIERAHHEDGGRAVVPRLRRLVDRNWTNGGHSGRHTTVRQIRMVLHGKDCPIDPNSE